MGLWSYLFLGLIKIQEEMRTKLNRKTTQVGETLNRVHTTRFPEQTKYIILFYFIGEKKKILKNPVTDFASWTKSNIFLSERS